VTWPIHRLARQLDRLRALLSFQVGRVSEVSVMKTGHPVEWCAFDGGHTPGNVDGGGDDGAKTWTKGEVWKFFTQF
jgi:hypothetical protein